jgi:hypothetical protein
MRIAYVIDRHVSTLLAPEKTLADCPPEIRSSCYEVADTVQCGWYRLDDGTFVAERPKTLVELKALKQAALDELFDTRFDLSAFIREGTATNVTSNNVGSFLSTITNNYRTKRAQIASAADAAALDAINILSGWPNNP